MVGTLRLDLEETPWCESVKGKEVTPEIGLKLKQTHKTRQLQILREAELH